VDFIFDGLFGGLLSIFDHIGVVGRFLCHVLVGERMAAAQVMIIM